MTNGARSVSGVGVWENTHVFSEKRKKMINNGAFIFLSRKTIANDIAIKII